ncbi:MAG TPA: hypothetical protein PKL03_08530 [Candidatus Omnitrophota bacterium]|nr:hypothetical protein [Candidatus Omnitrophota bacterium]HNQ51465.1 hypothetical protein [Candidatus Omnitrophota bacterium]
MNMELTGMEDLFLQLKKRLSTPGRVISIDGVAQAGQKALADTLAGRFACQLIEVDHTADAQQLIAGAAAGRKKGHVIISGILMRRILAAAGLKPDIAIYVIPSEKNSRRAFWEGILSKPQQEYLAELKADLDKKTVEYHWKHHPIINADYLVEGDE